MHKHKYKICHLLYEEFPRDPRARRYVNALNETGILSIVICSKKKKDKYFEIWKGNLVYRIPVAKHRQSFFLTSLEYISFSFVSTFMLAYLGIRYRFKIIQVHTLPDFLIFAAMLNKLLGAKLILDLHEVFPELFIARKPHLESSFWVKLLKFTESVSIKLANLVLTIHDPAKEILLKRNKGLEKKLHVIMNGVDPSEITNKNRVYAGDFIILYNGTVVKLLNLQIIIQALKILKSKMSDEDFKKIKFIIYGDGPAVNELLELSEKLNLKEKVIYNGFIPQNKIFEEVLKASVCILPPIKNIYSDLFYTTKLTEMIYLKIPVIATRLNTYKHYYSEDALFYFDSGNVEQLPDRIMEVFYNKELVSSKTEKAFLEYQKVSWEIMKKKYLEIINGLK
ncbi:MAG: glycosyltransferase [Ignavibacteria bacterium]